jgi:hypothetical protein
MNKMKNLTNILLKRHPKLTNAEANKYILLKFGSLPPRIMNLPMDQDGSYYFETNLYETIVNVINNNNLFERQCSLRPSLDVLEMDGGAFEIELSLGSTDCLNLGLKHSSNGTIVVTLEMINITQKCPSDVPPIKYLQDLKLFLKYLKDSINKPLVFQISHDVSHVIINPIKYKRSINVTKEKLIMFFSQYNIAETRLFKVFQEPFENEESQLHNTKKYFEKIFRKDVNEITLSDFFKKLYSDPNNDSKIRVFSILAILIYENENIILNYTDNIINQNNQCKLINASVNNFFIKYNDHDLSMKLSLRFSRILSDGKPWYMLFFNGLNYCSYNSSDISYEDNIEFNNKIEEVRNTVIVTRHLRQLSVTDFVKEFNLQLKNESKLYFYDLMLYYEIEMKIKEVFEYHDYRDYCMMV